MNKRIIALIGGLLVMTNISGCGFVTSEKSLKKAVETSLENKYQEEFVCLDVWTSNTYRGVCAPEENHDIRFEVDFKESGEIISDGYYAACVAEPLEESVQEQLEEVFSDFYLHSYMTLPLESCDENDIYAENVRNKSFVLEDYIKLDGEIYEPPTCISFALCINSSGTDKLSAEEEYQKLYDIFTQIEDYGIGVILYMKFLPEDVYLQCQEYLETCACGYSGFEELIRDYPMKVSERTLFVDFKEGKLKLSKEEYINQRTGE